MTEAKIKVLYQGSLLEKYVDDAESLFNTAGVDFASIKAVHFGDIVPPPEYIQALGQTIDNKIIVLTKLDKKCAVSTVKVGAEIKRLKYVLYIGPMFFAVNEFKRRIP
jgi:hypothetical protein